MLVIYKIEIKISTMEGVLKLFPLMPNYGI